MFDPVFGPVGRSPLEKEAVLKVEVRHMEIHRVGDRVGDRGADGVADRHSRSCWSSGEITVGEGDGPQSVGWTYRDVSRRRLYRRSS